jgi:hypothetical protein
MGCVASAETPGASSRPISAAGWLFTEQVSMTRLPAGMRGAVLPSTSSKAEMATQKNTAGSASTSPSAARVTPGGTGCEGLRDHARTSA